MGDSCELSFVIPVFDTRRRLRIVPIGVTICHLINSLHNATTYGRRGLSLNMGNRSLPTTTSSSACARLCTCGKSTRAIKKKVIEEMDFVTGLNKEKYGVKRKYVRCLSRLRRGLVSAMYPHHYKHNALPEYMDPIVTFMISSCFSRSEPTRFSNSSRCSDANDCTAVPLFYGCSISQRECKEYHDGHHTLEHSSQNLKVRSSFSHSAS